MKRKARSAAAQWPLDTGITVVLFAGLGGACAGLEEAGCPVHVANNHDPVALAAHAALHPHTRHVCGDIFDVDPIKATAGRRVRVLWASPDCRDHSVAKGGAPRSARVRSLPWQVCRWAGKTRPEVIFMENVREIRGWGRLVAKRDQATGRVMRLNGTVAARGERVPVQEQCLVRDKASLGSSFRSFVRHILRLGYDYDDRDLCCADYGVPTSRRRWFAVARRDGLPIVWPVRTHAPAGECETLSLQRWVGAYTIINWSIPLLSIFDRRKPLAEATNRRIAVGLRRFVLESATPFILPITHSGPPRVHSWPGQQPRVLDVKAPIGTVVASGGKFGLVAAWMAQHNFTVDKGVVGVDLNSPLSTVVTRTGPQSVAAAYFTHHRGESTAQGADAPVLALTTGGGHVAATAAFLVKYYSQGGVAQSGDDALHSLSCRMRFGVVTVELQGHTVAVADIGMRMLEPHEAAAAHELRLPAEILADGVRRKLTKTEAMRLVGNSVPKRMARLLAEANAIPALYATAIKRSAA